MHKQQRGFTIVEVMIVLAIAGIILLIVFIAIPSMMRVSRNYRRGRDVSALTARVQEYKSENLSLPYSCNNTDTSCYVRDVPMTAYDNQSTTENVVSFWNRTGVGAFVDGVDQQLDPSSPSDREHITVRSYTRCNGALFTGVNASKDSIAAQYIIETSSGGQLKCIEM